MTAIYISLMLIVLISASLILYYSRQLKKMNKEIKDEYSKKKYTYTHTTYQEPFTSYNNFIDEIILKIYQDFRKSPYIDKILLSTDIIFGYKFENGTKMNISKNYRSIRMVYDHESRILTEMELSKLIKEFKYLAKNAVKRPTYKSYWEDEYEPKVSWGKKEKVKKYTNEELKYQEKFRKLKSNHDARMRQLNNISKNDPNRPALVNEINAVKRSMKKIFNKSGLTMKKTK